MHIINMSTRRDGMALSRIPTSISTNRYATATRTSRTFITAIATANTKRSERFFQIEPDPDLKPLPPASNRAGETTGYYAGARQHGCAACTGGQTTDPYEQNTQQSPAFGLSSAPQLMQS